MTLKFLRSHPFGVWPTEKKLFKSKENTRLKHNIFLQNFQGKSNTNFSRFREIFRNFITAVKVKIRKKLIQLTAIRNLLSIPALMKKVSCFVTAYSWIIWMMPFVEYVFTIPFDLFSLQQLKTCWWFEFSIFSFTNILTFDILIFAPPTFLNFFLLYRICLQFFRFNKLTMFPQELPLDIHDIVRNSIYFYIIPLIVLLNRIRCCFLKYYFVL